VYCQELGRGPTRTERWRGIDRVLIPVSMTGPFSTLVFDGLAIWHAARSSGLCLTLGYNTALFCALLRIRGRTNVINMDGLEWQRAKWSFAARHWLWLNERAGCRLGNHLIADHPEIAKHLIQYVPKEKVTMLTYGAARLAGLGTEPLLSMGLQPGRFLTLIARPEPENSVLEIVRGFSRKHRGCQLCVLGRYERNVSYQQRVMDAAGPEVRFLGPIYDPEVVGALRCHSMLYVHGHQVGGTNPSLVEALGAGNAVIAHDNRFNRWVAGDAAHYFRDESEVAARFDELIGQKAQLDQLRAQARARHEASFRWDTVLTGYEILLARLASL
jgi:glycosyltransferase involved in cell wall biosynthesis